MIGIKEILEICVTILALTLASKAQKLSNESTKLQPGVQLISTGFWLFFVAMTMELVDSFLTGNTKQTLDIGGNVFGFAAFIVLLTGFYTSSQLAKRKK